MSCTCMSGVKDKIREKISASASRHVAESIKVSWQNQFWRPEGSNGCDVALKVEHEFRALKNDGTPYKNLTKGATVVFMSFCPFCGEKFEEEAA